jgi:photosystem II stability/assembly factor-like uncharacterized protein
MSVPAAERTCCSSNRHALDVKRIVGQAASSLDTDKPDGPMAHDAFKSHFANDKATAETGPAGHQVSKSGSQGNMKKHGGPRKWVLPTLGAVVLVSIVLGLVFGWEPAGVRWVDRTNRNLGAYELYSIFATSDGKRVWTVGGTTEIQSGNVIAESVDGGKTWSALTSGSTVDQLYGIFGTSDGGRLWTVGNRGTVLESDDGGKTWVARDSRTNADLRSIFGTSDGKHLWAVGGIWYNPGGESDVGVIVQSDDGGANWKARRTSAPGILQSVFGSSNGRRLFAVGEAGTMLQSNDGGATWVVRRSGASYDPLQSIFGTSDGRQLWAIELHGKLLESGDGGAAWTERDTGLEPPPPLEVADSEFVNGGLASSDGKHLWLVGQIGKGESIFESDDGGSTWKVRYFEYMPLNAIAGTADGKHLWAVGEGDTILESDAGW